MANESKIIQDVSNAVNSLSNSFQALSAILEGSITKQKTQITYINSLKASLSSKEFKDFVKTQQDIQQAQKQLSSEQEKAIKIAKEQEVLKQQVLKTQQAAIKAAQTEAVALENKRKATANAEKAELSLKTAKDKVNKTSNDAVGAYQRESNKLRELTQKAKDAAIQYGINSKQAKAFRIEQQALDKKLKDVDASLGIHNREVGNYKKGLSGVTGILGKFGIGLGGAQIAMKAFDGIISNSQAAGDAWAISLGTLKGAFEGLFQAIGTGEGLAGIIKAMKDGAKAGAEYAAAIDDLFERREGMELIISEIETKIAKAQIARDVARAKKDRTEALRQVDLIKSLEEEKLAVIINYNEKEIKAEEDIFNGKYKITQAEFKTFLTNYRKEDELRKKASEYLDIEKRVDNAKRNLTSQSAFETQVRNEMIRGDEEILNTANRDVVIYASFLKKWGTTSDERIEKYAKALISMENAKRDSIQAQRRNEVARAKEEELFDAETNKAKEEAYKKHLEDMAKLRKDLEKKYGGSIEDTQLTAWKDEADIQKELADEVAEHKIDTLDKIQEKNKEVIEAQKEATAKLAEYEKEIDSEKRELLKTSIDSFFEMQDEKYEKELEKNNKYYDGLLANETLSEEQRSLIEAEREKKENEINERKRENEKKQFLFNQLMKIGEIWMEAAKGIAAANAMAPATAGLSLAWIPKIKISAALQTGVVMAQSVPKFDKGTKNTPSDYIISEKRPEIHVSKKGKATLITEPTYISNDAGSTIIGGVDTARIMDNINNYSTANIISEGKTIKDKTIDIAILADKLIKNHTENTNKMIQAFTKNDSKASYYREKTSELRNRLKN